MNSDFKELLLALEKFGAEYLVVGGYAVMAYTEPRYTKDLDVWVRPEALNADRVFRSLAHFGAPLDDVAVDNFATEGLVFQIGMAPVRVDILMSIDGVNFSEAWDRKKRMDLGGVECWVLSPQDLVVNKELAARPQDLMDAHNLRRAMEAE